VQKICAFKLSKISSYLLPSQKISTFIFLTLGIQSSTRSIQPIGDILLICGHAFLSTYLTMLLILFPKCGQCKTSFVYSANRHFSFGHLMWRVWRKYLF
jgi:hypothetical protein